MSTISLSPEQFIFASDNTLKTTSLKIAERFEKDHSNVLKAIDKILTQVSDSFGEVNFNVSDYEQENNLGIMTRYRSYDLTRDGFMIVVMSFTGKAAMEVKEWYINAFNLMHEKLFPVQYGLKELPPSPYISEAEATQFKKSMEAHCKGNRKLYSDLYRRVYDYYGITTYMHIEAGKLEEAALVCGFKLLKLVKRNIPKSQPVDDVLHLTPLELSAVIKENIERLKVGEIMPKDQTNCLTVDLKTPTGLQKIIFKFLTEGYSHGRWTMTMSDGCFIISPMEDDKFIMNLEQFIKYATQERGYLVVKKSEIVSKLQA